MFGLTFGLKEKLQREEIDWDSYSNLSPGAQDWLGDMYFKYVEGNYVDKNPEAYAATCRLNQAMKESTRSKRIVPLITQEELTDERFGIMEDVLDSKVDIAVDTVEEIMEQQLMESYKVQIKDMEEYLILEERVSLLGLLYKAREGNKRSILKIRELCENYDGLSEIVKIAIKEIV